MSDCRSADPLHGLSSKAALIVALCLGTPGCVTNPITGRSQTLITSDAEASRESATAYSRLLQEAQTHKTLDTDAPLLARVEAISRPLIAQAAQLRPETRSWSWDVHVLKSKEINAWCMAGGKMAVYTGLLQQIQPSDDELAAIMGHEIAHALLSHQAEKVSRAQLQRAGIQAGVLAGALFGYRLGSMASLADNVATLGLQLPNSREAESEADSVGLELAARAGFNPQAAVTLWQKMGAHSTGGTPEWLSTHPDTPSRIKAMQIKADQLMPVYETARKQQALPEQPNVRFRTKIRQASARVTP